LKILFDTQIFDWQISGGISRYFIEVLQRLKDKREIEILFKCRHSYNTYIQDTPWLTGKPLMRNTHFKGKLSMLKIINQKVNRIYSNRLLKKGAFDIFQPTYYDPYFLPYLSKKPFVLTVYDLTYEKFKDNRPQIVKLLEWKKLLINRADHIISISENTKKDVIEHYSIAPEKITTVYLSGGFDPSIRQASPVQEMNAIPERFILFVGSRSGYKNFNGFIKEAAPVLRNEDISLVVAGGGPINAEESALLKNLNVDNRVISFSHVSDIFLAQLYSKAMVFVFPSLYEGFGIPVLEAMQCGCPALLSNNSSLPEVGGNAAVYYDPYASSALESALRQLVRNEAERERMTAAGYEQVKKFNWDATAAGHLALYKKMTG
jgi:glycosyltransferase involved in cell wall biosynthesis